jgi:hypothetical protein
MVVIIAFIERTAACLLGDGYTDGGGKTDLCNLS